MPSVYDAGTNVWGYNTGVTAPMSNTFTGSKDNDQIVSVSGSLIVGGWRIMNLTTWTQQDGAKGTIDASVLSKQYLSQNLSDPALKDIKVGNDKTFQDFGLGEYVYGVYAKWVTTDWTSITAFPTIKRGSAYNLAVTIADDQKIAVTKITGNFDSSICVGCQTTLVGSGAKDGASYSGSAVSNSGITIPYPISGF